MSYRTEFKYQWIVFMLIGLLLPAYTSASSVLKVTLEESSLNTDFIFEGRVVSKETRPSPLDSRPYTYFTFEIIDVIKGAYPNKTIEIGFAGGTINGMTLSVTGLNMPKLQESGIYFVESLSQELINPLYGWDQGHYIINTINNVSKVSQASEVSGTGPSAQALTAAPSLIEFKQKIRNILNGVAQ